MLSLIVLSALALQVGVFAEDDNTLALVCMNLPKNFTISTFVVVFVVTRSCDY